MIRHIEAWRKWEAAQRAAEPVDYERNLRWYESALEYARALGAWPPADPMEGFEQKLAYIHRLHGVKGHPGPVQTCATPARSLRQGPGFM